MEQEYYAEYEELQRHHWWFVGRRRILAAVLTDLADGQPRILDFGAGTGTNVALLERFGKVTAVDGDREAVERATRQGHTALHVPDGSPLPFPDGAFDLVCAFDVLEHIRDDVAAMAELRRVLRPGGHLLVTVPAFQALWGDQDEISHHERRYRAPQLRERLAAAGLEVRRTTYFNTILFPPIAAVRLVRRLLRPPDAGRTDFRMGGSKLDAPLAAVFGIEARLVRRRRLPFGVSLLAVARR